MELVAWSQWEGGPEASLFYGSHARGEICSDIGYSLNMMPWEIIWRLLNCAAEKVVGNDGALFVNKASMSAILFFLLPFAISSGSWPVIQLDSEPSTAHFAV